MARHHQRRRRPRPRHVAARGGAGGRARRLGFRRPPLSGRALTAVVCAGSLVGLPLILPSAIGAGRSAPRVAVATSAAPTTLPQASGTARTAATRTRPGMALSSTASSRAATTTTGGRRPTTTTLGAAEGWVNVVNDQFGSGGVPAHWSRYDGPYGSGPRNCGAPSHVSVSGGSMHMLMRYEGSGRCGAGWYTGGMMLDKAFASVDQRVTVRFRVVSGGVSGHHIIPMRFPPGAPWPQGGEEDYCEGSEFSGCHTFLHYGDKATTQVSHRHGFDLRQWHTVRFERRDHVVKAYIDDLGTPVWTYRGSSRTLPDTKKQVVLQQECRASGCPAGSAGTEDIQIDWITVDNPA
jgi:hypothetical protein